MSKILESALLSAKSIVALAVQSVLEEAVFPWYEAKTGRYSNDRNMRKAVAQRIESNVSATLWISRREFLEMDGLAEDSDYTLFQVAHVFPQATDVGQYDLRVTIFPVRSRTSARTLTLEEFLHNFVPQQSLNFNDLDS